MTPKDSADHVNAESLLPPVSAARDETPAPDPGTDLGDRSRVHLGCRRRFENPAPGPGDPTISKGICHLKPIPTARWRRRIHHGKEGSTVQSVRGLEKPYTAVEKLTTLHSPIAW